ncbi:kinesin-domain-containing protein [Myriangium duriaei CBS 260.36]|uniref:Kinesin-domain-containing protein n=1 Tax=Myriangium duriaei CBS 260.36 TaxID=1168546 RepID=A0A9P4MGM3_9PEZI|nr:kinesin-domain-containing protein [Myriangium duriaei CBS 260.36]
MAMPPPLAPSPFKAHQKRPSSAILTRASPRSTSRQSISSKLESTTASGSRASDDDARTAVKVAIRVRPPLQPEDPGYDLIPQRFRRSTCEVTSPSNISIQSSQGKKVFVFDKVFGEEVDQAGVWDYINDSVDSFVQGYNVSILAYGQSGAGKSYTMGTSDPEDRADPSARGIVPRAAAALFEKLSGPPTRSGLRSPQRYSTIGLPTLQSMPKLGAQVDKAWQLKATYVEIYNEQLRDLLLDDTVPIQDRPQVSIREDTKGRILLTGLTQVDINSTEDLLDALNFGSSIRQTDATAINAKSSRSHAVFSLNLIQKKSGQQATSHQDKRRSVPVESLAGSETSVTIDSKLHFVDLAGSERLKNTGAQGERAKEGISINAGLASLGKVIAQLSSRNHGAHVSYRDSRLTRLLQDSLGGNAITYMIACINPAEFHLSETMNTVTYAQRARAIQSKPEIQQTLSESDKLAQIERLKAEVAFLRDQVSQTRSTHKSAPSFDTTDGRTMELQNQLMDMQENYQALSQRHERMISELGRSRDGDDIQVPESLLAGAATDRLQRSSSFAVAVESVVMEYEKTIQSLESSLTNTRSTLSNTESALMERESKIAYLEAATQQFQSRIQKLVTREQHTEQYLQELESKLENVASNEESTASVVASLRKELGRAKENQASTEDYIAALEQRLAEAEQDHDIMKREFERLEQVVDRQRNLGRVDWQSVDSPPLPKPQHVEVVTAPQPTTNGFSNHISEPDRSLSDSPPSPLAADADTLTLGPHAHDPVSPLEDVVANQPLPPSQNHASGTVDDKQAAQSSFMADKLETLTQELFDLRGEHEITVNDFDELKRKYTIALQSLAKFQDSDNSTARDENTQASLPRSDSFLGQVTPGLPPQHPGGESLRSLSSESSSQPDTNNSASVDDSTVARSATHSRMGQNLSFNSEVETPVTEMDTTAHLVRDSEYAELMRNHEKLIAVHREALIEVDILKAELQKSHSDRMPSPRVKSPLVRRKPSQDMIASLNNVDRANRSFASLRNIALDHFESNPDVRQNFELQLETIMVELHSRTERTQQLESEMMTLRQQLEEKITIITGLTRERASRQAASNVDFSAVSLMRDQIIESEQQIKTLQDTNAAHEQQFQAEISSLRAQLDAHVSAKKVENESSVQSSTQTADGVERLQSELSSWQTKHDNMLQSVKASEAKLLATIADLEASLHTSSRVLVEHSIEDQEAAAENDQPSYGALVDKLQQIMHEHLVAGRQQAQKLSQLEGAHNETLKSLKESGESKVALNEELQKHQALTEELQEQLAGFEASIDGHEAALHLLKDAHHAELERLQSETHQVKSRQMSLQEEHETSLSSLEHEMKKHQEESAAILVGLSSVLGGSVDRINFKTRIQEVLHSKRVLENREVQSMNDKKALEDELASLGAHNAQLQDKVGELKMLHDAALKNVDAISKKEQKSARLVQELEDQLSNNYDQTQLNNNRLSELQTEKHLQLQEALHAKMELEKEVEDCRLRVGYLEAQLNDMRRRSNASASTARDSSVFYRDSLSPEAAAIALARSSSASSITMRRPSPPMDPSALPTALPSPPPAIPLPPLPNSPVPGSIDSRTVSPPPSYSRPITPHNMLSLPPDPTVFRQLEESETRIRTVEKHLYAEKQLTATLEEALVDLETAQNKTRQDLDQWRRKATSLEDELIGLRKERSNSRASMQQVEEEREMRVRAERARRALEEQMRGLEMERKKKKKSGLNCF